MAKDKYKRKAGKSARSFLRTIGQGTAPGASILVVTEGDNAEPVYFDAIRRVFASTAIELVPHGAGRGDPRKLTEAALRYRKERRKQARNKELSISQLEDFDQIWIVFDTDVLKPDKRNDGIAYAMRQGVKVASSEPCFEYWLLLHSAKSYTTAAMEKCDDVKPYLKKAFGWEGYDKNLSECRKLIGPIVTKPNVSAAVTAADRVRKHHEAVGTPFPANPSTDVDLLINAINDAVAKANKVTSK
jgi:hypothetical protein